MQKIKIAATGLDGLVGSRILELLKDNFDFISLSEQMLDITNEEKVKNVLSNISFDFFLHLAAYTNVDASETNREICRRVNVDGTRNLLEQVLAKKSKFIFISTDFVFDGNNPPYFESSKPNPQSYYGKTKLEGEKLIDGNGMIIRISYPYRSKYKNKPDIVRSIYSALQKQQCITGTVDQLLTPTLIDDIAYGFQYLVMNYSPEIFHVVGRDSVSGLELILKICQKFNFNTNLVSKTTFADFYRNKAPRPQKSVLKTDKKNNYLKMNGITEGLELLKQQGIEI